MEAGAKPHRMPRGLVTALRTLTILPVPGDDSETPADALPWFPAIGAALGIIICGLLGVMEYLTKSSPGPAVVAVAASVFLTRGLHLDGLADCADAFWGGWDRERILAIMKDSALGTFGTIALVLVLLAKWCSIAALIDSGALNWIIIAMTVSRAVQVDLATGHDYARPEGGTGARFIGSVDYGCAGGHLRRLLVAADHHALPGTRPRARLWPTLPQESGRYDRRPARSRQRDHRDSHSPTRRRDGLIPTDAATTRPTCTRGLTTETRRLGGEVRANPRLAVPSLCSLPEALPESPIPDLRERVAWGVRGEALSLSSNIHGGNLSAIPSQEAPQIHAISPPRLSDSVVNSHFSSRTMAISTPPADHRQPAELRLQSRPLPGSRIPPGRETHARPCWAG